MLPRLAVLLSGSGSTLQNLIHRITDGLLSASIAGVVSSRPDVLGVERARTAGIPVTVVPQRARKAELSSSEKSPHPSGTSSEAVFEILRLWKPDLVVLAGWIHLLRIPTDFERKVVNVHPSLLPAFGGKGMYGRHVHEAVLASGARVSGCTVHFADDTYDTGPIIHQAVVPVEDADTPESLGERVQAAEREAYPHALAKILAGGWHVSGNRVRWE